MERHQVLAAAAMAVFLLCGAAFAGAQETNRRRENESVEPGAMPKERARIMGYGADDPRAAADARRNLGGNDNTDDDARARKDKRRKAKKAAVQ